MIEIGHLPFSPTKISLQPDSNSKRLPTLSRNEVVQGKVLKSFSSGEVLLLIKGRKVMAKAHVPVREGKVLSLKVEELSPHPTLKLLGLRLTAPQGLNVSSILSAMKENLWKSVFGGTHHHALPKEALSPLRELMNDLTLRLFLESPPGILKELIERSGGYYSRSLE